MTAAPQHTEHIRRRPSWDCACCGQPWPCANAKENLVREFNRFPTVLTIFMATQMYEAFDDLAPRIKLPPRHLYERFLAWIVIPPPDDPAPQNPTGDDPAADNDRDAG